MKKLCRSCLSRWPQRPISENLGGLDHLWTPPASKRLLRLRLDRKKASEGAALAGLATDPDHAVARAHNPPAAERPSARPTNLVVKNGSKIRHLTDSPMPQTLSIKLGETHSGVESCESTDLPYASRSSAPKEWSRALLPITTELEDDVTTPRDGEIRYGQHRANTPGTIFPKWLPAASIAGSRPNFLFADNPLTIDRAESSDSFIFGLPTDRPDTFQATQELAQHSGIAFAQFLILTPFCGTVDFERWEKRLGEKPPEIDGIPITRYWLIPARKRPKTFIPHPMMSSDEM